MQGQTSTTLSQPIQATPAPTSLLAPPITMEQLEQGKKMVDSERAKTDAEIAKLRAEIALKEQQLEQLKTSPAYIPNKGELYKASQTNTPFLEDFSTPAANMETPKVIAREMADNAVIYTEQLCARYGNNDYYNGPGFCDSFMNFLNESDVISFEQLSRYFLKQPYNNITLADAIKKGNVYADEIKGILSRLGFHFVQKHSAYGTSSIYYVESPSDWFIRQDAKFQEKMEGAIYKDSFLGMLRLYVDAINASIDLKNKDKIEKETMEAKDIEKRTFAMRRFSKASPAFALPYTKMNYGIPAFQAVPTTLLTNRFFGGGGNHDYIDAPIEQLLELDETVRGLRAIKKNTFATLEAKGITLDKNTNDAFDNRISKIGKEKIDLLKKLQQLNMIAGLDYRYSDGDLKKEEFDLLMRDIKQGREKILAEQRKLVSVLQNAVMLQYNKIGNASFGRMS